ncbi:penicillin-binding transpeptidase domain-containing protein [Ornithinibacillus contaminans]|uniref:penicillin-binding transpeptidase domain-containing protein n=1 Tax=Ornithinibacillus contaminans TaxID=694055 RepID=UPI00064E0784|nr:penicillin-binding transpeptidase domain-containing protein [Ornithinibacillus contaminans]
MKRLLLLVTSILLILIAGCSEDEITPHERFDTYIDLWSEQDFTQMYEILTPESKETYATDQYIDRYNKIYEDLQISNIDITYTKLSEEQLEKALKEGTATLPFSITMESLAGPISFDYEATLVQQGEEEEKDWFLTWDPGFIFPEIKDGGEIRITTTEPTRGEILDRNQLPLALNGEVLDIGIVPGKLGDNPDASIEKIASLLNLSVDTINNYLNASWVQPDYFVPLNRQVPESNEELLNQLWEIGGVMGQTGLGRVYPLGESAAHLVGYVGNVTAEQLEELDPSRYSANDIIGKAGLERLYEDRLKGEKGAKIYVLKEDETEIVLAEKEVQNGENIQTTIDSTVQEEIYHSLDGAPGTAAAIHPKTGETLALVSSPSFDPMKMVYGISQTEWDELQNDPNQPMFNRFAATYAPGSVIKPITTVIGLQNGTIKPEEKIEIDGKTWSNGEGWGNYAVTRVTEASPVNLLTALTLSDNIYFAMKGVEMGGDALATGLEQFGFGEELPIDLSITTSSISTTGALEDEVLTANTAYGQGEIETSVLHMASMFTTFLNDGAMIKPTILKSDETGPYWKENLATTEEVSIIQEALRNVVLEGTAGYAKNAPFPISGKTGTAELKLTLDEKDGVENGWFVGYPTDDQDILIAMMMEGVQDIGASGLVVEKVTNILEAVK